MKTARELRDELQATRKQWFALYESRPNKDFTADEVEELRQKQAQMDDLGQQYQAADLREAAEQLRAAEEVEASRPVNRLPSGKSVQRDIVENSKSLRDLFAESPSFQSLRNGHAKTATIDVPDETYAREMGGKALLSSANWSIPADRRPGLLESVQLNITVSDLMLQGTTDAPSITYMEETAFVNNAATVAEGGVKPESELGFTERVEPVRKIATNIPITEELLQDVPAMESYLRQRLAFMVERRREVQLLSGNGTAPNLRGILNRTGIQTIAKTAGVLITDLIFTAMTNIAVNADAEPDGIVIHPTNWASIRLMKTATGSNEYVLGAPTEYGPMRLFGVPVRVSTAVPVNTALVGAFRPHAQIFRRTGLTVNIYSEHSDFVVRNQLLVQAEERLALAVYRPAAFHTITALNVA